jgi:DNA mismatch repair ATPase MutS
MDEMLKGTVEDAGAQRVYEAGIKLAQKPQSIVIMATHFEKPTKLEITTNGGFMNYHVGLVEKEDGQFKRTFELVRGANLWWFQDASKRNRFINWLTSLNN